MQGNKCEPNIFRRGNGKKRSLIVLWHFLDPLVSLMEERIFDLLNKDSHPLMDNSPAVFGALSPRQIVCKLFLL
jgi:hypothetical protein